MIQPLTSGPLAHFFGYYDKPPWDRTGRWLLCLEARETGRMPQPDEPATIGLVDLNTGECQSLARTLAWNWQQGAMLQWLEQSPVPTIIFNDRIDDQLVSVVLEVETGRRRVLPRPIYAVDRSGRFALCLNPARLARHRPLVGYRGVVDPWADDPHPADDGVWRMDLATGESELVLSLDEVARLRPAESMRGAHHRFEHATIAPNGRRFFVLHRWPRPGSGRPFHDRLVTADTRGGQTRLLAGDDLVSHFDWRDSDHILAWARVEGEGDHFFLFEDQSAHHQAIGPDVLTRDAHCSYSPDRTWILGDSYPNRELEQELWIYHVASGTRYTIGRLATQEHLRKNGAIRCDLHPRWSRDGRTVCIDSAHEGARQMYAVDVEPIISSFA
ncbi:MAG: hypothetical protein JJU36_08935 [Phycisphaeraceae bacterium]|nr:hypothetical protein [Phycisphaeraceae bacterium]